jgi:hypothetical protein
VFTTGAGTLTVSDNLGQSLTQTVETGSMQLVSTGWAQASTVVTVNFTSGQNLGIDDIAYSGDGGTYSGPAPYQGTVLNDSGQPGSVLVFPKFRRGTVTTTDQLDLPASEFEISVLCPRGQEAYCNSLPGASVTLLAHWVCGDDDTTSTGSCPKRDFTLTTTINGTIVFDPENVLFNKVSLFNPRPNDPFNLSTPGARFAPPPDCQRGYLIVWVVDGPVTRRPIKFDGLIGDAVQRNEENGENSAGAYNAIPIQARHNLATGALTDANGDGNLDFNGTEYQAVTGRIYGTVRYPGPIVRPNANPMLPPVLLGFIRTELILLTLDVLRTINQPTFVNLNFYNEDEELRSVEHSFRCVAFNINLQDDLGLTNTFGRKGLVESDRLRPGEQRIPGQPAVPVTILGVIETQERRSNFGDIIREYWYSLYNDGTPIDTTFEP